MRSCHAMSPKKAAEFTVSLRIPSWNEEVKGIIVPYHTYNQ